KPEQDSGIGPCARCRLCMHLIFRHFLAVTAARTQQFAAGTAAFLHQTLPAFGAGIVRRPVPGHIIAVRITVASVEYAPFLAAPLDNSAFRTFRAGDADI